MDRKPGMWAEKALALEMGGPSSLGFHEVV